MRWTLSVPHDSWLNFAVQCCHPSFQATQVIKAPQFLDNPAVLRDAHGGGVSSLDVDEAQVLGSLVKQAFDTARALAFKSSKTDIISGTLLQKTSAPPSQTTPP